MVNLTHSERTKALANQLVPCVCPRCDGIGKESKLKGVKRIVLQCSACSGQQWILLEREPSVIEIH